jgi:hypothetical protein
VALGGVGGDHALLDVVVVGEAEVLLGVTWQSIAVPYQPMLAAPMAEVMWS